MTLVTIEKNKEALAQDQIDVCPILFFFGVL